MTDTHTGRLLAAIPAEKRTKKRRDTVVGIVLGGIGLAAAVVGGALAVRQVWTGGSIDMWTVALFGGFLGVGLLLMLLAGLVMSGELVRAGLADIVNAVRSVWRRNGGSS